VPGTEGGLAGGQVVGDVGGIAETFEDTASTLGVTIEEDLGGFPQGFAAEIAVDAVAFDAIKKGRDLDELGAHGDETVIDQYLGGGGVGGEVGPRGGHSGSGKCWDYFMRVK